MLKVGVIGAGHFGKIHLKLLKQSTKFNLIGFYDSNIDNSKKVSKEFDYQYYENISALLDEIEVVIIATPTHSHFEYAQMAIKKGKHIFIEKPISNSLKEAIKIIALAEKYQVKGQVGHVERFNPAFLAAKKLIINPMFIESHRLAEFNPRGTDVPVVLDLMIHDIDIVLSVVKSKVKQISASGVAVISKTPDIANARIEFENGCVANLTASRVSLKNMRKSRFFQKDTYIDEFALILYNAEGEKKQIYFDTLEIISNNAILDELESFAQSINKNISTIVSLHEGTEALKLAHQINKSIKINHY